MWPVQHSEHADLRGRCNMWSMLICVANAAGGAIFCPPIGTAIWSFTDSSFLAEREVAGTWMHCLGTYERGAVLCLEQRFDLRDEAEVCCGRAIVDQNLAVAVGDSHDPRVAQLHKYALVRLAPLGAAETNCARRRVHKVRDEATLVPRDGHSRRLAHERAQRERTSASGVGIGTRDVDRLMRNGYDQGSGWVGAGG